MIILDRLIDRVGNVNPQLFRELKERLTIRNIVIASAIALTIQSLILFHYNTQLPPAPTYDLTYARAYGVPKKLVTHFNNYCTGKFINKDLMMDQPSEYAGTNRNDLCTVNLAGDLIIDWQKWWSDVCIDSGWVLFSGLILGSVYMLVADLLQEEKRGTMNFIRLSPRSPREIFIGKILGVPVLVYLAVAEMVPLHLLSGINGGASLGIIASWYIAIGSFWFLLSSASILYVLLGGAQAILTTMAVSAPIGLLFLKDQNKHLNFGSGYEYGWGSGYWFGLPVLENSTGMYGFESIVFIITSYWIWQALERRYLNPQATAISKVQSHLINIGLQILVAGFAISYSMISPSSHAANIALLAAIDFTLLVLSTLLLLPSKQSLQDWSRYRRERATSQNRKFWQRELFQDLLFNDQSPALLSIAINIGVSMLLWIPVSLYLSSDSGIGFKFLACIGFGASLVLIYATIAHLVLFLNVKKHNLWTMGIIAVVVTLPIGVALIISSGRTPTGLAAFILLFSPFAPAGVFGLPGEIIFAAFTAQLAMLAVLTRQLQRKLQISGQSHTKTLLARN
jgi:hypothetical protein